MPGLIAMLRLLAVVPLLQIITGERQGFVFNEFRILARGLAVLTQLHEGEGLGKHLVADEKKAGFHDSPVCYLPYFFVQFLCCGFWNPPICNLFIGPDRPEHQQEFYAIVYVRFPSISENKGYIVGFPMAYSTISTRALIGFTPLDVVCRLHEQPLPESFHPLASRSAPFAAMAFAPSRGSWMVVWICPSMMM
jgi:hypothetical protein